MIEDDDFNYYSLKDKVKSANKKESLNLTKDIQNYLTENLLAVYTGGDLPFGYITRETFNQFIPSDDFANCVIVDIFNKQSYDCNMDGEIFGSRICNEYESGINIYSTFGEIPKVDIYGDPINTTDLEKKEEIKNDYVGIPVNVTYLSMIDNNIRKFYEVVDPSKLEFETTIEKLIKVSIIDPDQFDEIFTIETDRPESPLMRKFLTKLAELVNDKLEASTLKDDGIDDIEELQKIAYTHAGYTGKTLETVIEEKKDYDGYFRFLLMKGEKIVITEQQKEYFDKLKAIVKKEFSNQVSSFVIPNKKKNKDIELKGISAHPGLAGTMYFTGLVPSLIVSKSEMRAIYFTYIENIHDIYDEIEKSSLKLKIALNADLIHERNGEIKKGVEVKNYIFVCDKNFNYAFFEVRKSTLNKWKKSLTDKIIEMFSCLSTKSVAPRGFNEFVL
jgi:hypothetical protein